MQHIQHNKSDSNSPTGVSFEHDDGDKGFRRRRRRSCGTVVIIIIRCVGSVKLERRRQVVSYQWAASYIVKLLYHGRNGEGFCAF